MSDLEHGKSGRHPNNLAREIQNLKQQLARSKEMLARPVPDTFLGRSHYNPVPLPYEDRYREATRLTLCDPNAPSPSDTGIDRAALADRLGVLVHAAVEQAKGEARAAFYLANRQLTTLHHVTGMTQDYARYVDGFAIGTTSLACGLAAATRNAVITPDVILDQRWDGWHCLARKFGYRACWSFPVEAENGQLLGTFAMYYEEPAEARPQDLELASLLTRTAAKIISRR
jgi:hypothetical protein